MGKRLMAHDSIPGIHLLLIGNEFLSLGFNYWFISSLRAFPILVPIDFSLIWSGMVLVWGLHLGINGRAFPFLPFPCDQSRILEKENKTQGNLHWMGQRIQELLVLFYKRYK